MRMISIFRKQGGHIRFSLLASIGYLFAGLILLAIGYFIFCEARKAYWDRQVKEMCEKDGGIKIYEHVSLSQFSRYVDRDGNVRIPLKTTERLSGAFLWEAKPDDIFYRESHLELIRSKDPTVGKSHIKVIRKVDKKLLGEGLFYGRSGGDFPSFAFPSSFTCPPDKGDATLIKAIFTVNKN